MAGDVVAIAVGRATQHKHVFARNVNRHVVERRLHDAAGPTPLVGGPHLLVTIRVRRGRKQERRADRAAEERRLERHGAKGRAGQNRAALGPVLETRRFRALQIRVGFQRRVFATRHGLHHRRRTEHHVAGVEDPRASGDRQLGPVADGRNDHVEFAEDRRFLPDDDEVLRPGRLAGHERGLRYPKTFDPPALVDDGEQFGAGGDLDAVGEQHVPLILRQRHVLQPAAIDQFYRGRAASLRRRSAVHGHRAAPEDGDLLATNAEALLVGQVVLPGKDMLLPRNVQPDRLTQPRAHDQGVVFQPQRRWIGDGPAGFELHRAEAPEKRQVGAHDLLGETKVRNEIHHAAGPLLLLVDGDLVAALREHARRAHPRGTRADDADGLPVRRGAPEFRQPDFVGFSDHRGLHGRDLDRAVERPAGARLHAEVIGTHDAAHPTQRIRSLDQGRRPAEVGLRADARRHDEIGGRTMRRTGLPAGFFLAVNAPVQLRPQLGVGEESFALFHGVKAARMGWRDRGRLRWCVRPACCSTGVLAVEWGRGIRAGGSGRWRPVYECSRREPTAALVLWVIRIEDCRPLCLRISWPKMRTGAPAGRRCGAAGTPPVRNGSESGGETGRARPCRQTGPRARRPRPAP